MSDIRKRPTENADSSEEILGHLTWCSTAKEEMQDQLAELLFQDEEIDIETLGLLLDRMEQAGQFPDSPNTEESLKRFHRQHTAIFEDANVQNTPAPVPAKKRLWRAIQKAVAATAVILLLCTAAQALGMDVFSTFARWTSEILCLGGRPASYASVQYFPLAEGERANFDSLEDAVAAFGIEAPIIPKEIPERFELVSVVAANQKSGILIYAKYESEDGNFQVYYKEIDRYNYHSIEIGNEYTDAAPYVVNRIKHYLTSDNGRQKADWENGDFECQLVGVVSEEELKKIIHSIY